MWTVIGRGGHQGRLNLLALSAAVAGAALIVVAIVSQQSAPIPPASAAGTIGPRPATSLSSASGQPAAELPPVKDDKSEPPLPRSLPVSISIPAIDVQSAIFPIGKNEDGTLKVPQPGPNLNKVAWFENSPTPGQSGPAVLEGHVDSVQGPSVFFELGDVRPGNKINIARKDGSTAVFTVNAVRDYDKKNFPTKLVYGGENIGQPALRLITCSDFDTSISHHVGNLIAFAELTSVTNHS